jgi:hypothetical protein
MLVNRGELDGARILSPLTVDYMMRNHLAGGDKDIAQMSQPYFLNANRHGQVTEIKGKRKGEGKK